MKELTGILSNIDNQYLLALVVLVCFFMYLFKEPISKIIGKIKFKKNKYKIADLKNHALFAELESYKSFRKDFQTHGEFDESKTKIFNDFLELKLTSTSANMMSISELATADMDREALKTLVLNSFNDCNKELQCTLVTRFVNKGLNRDDANMVLDKFYIVRQNAMDKYKRRIDSIFGCSYYQTNFHLVLAIYEMIAFEIEDITEHSVETFESINGAFMDLDYD